MWDVLALTRLVGHERHKIAALTNPHPITEIGKLTLRYIQDEDSVPFSGGRGYTCCSGAEAWLLRTTNPENVHDAGYISPVLITGNDQPIAVIKGFPQRTSYGLRTDLSHGIVAGAFSEPPMAVLQRMRTGTRPYYLDVNEHGMATPLRVGGFLVPKSIREELVVDSERGIRAAPTEGMQT